MKVYSDDTFVTLRNSVAPYFNISNITDEGCLGDYGDIDTADSDGRYIMPFLYGDIRTQHGNSYDGFLSCCEGWLSVGVNIDPRWNEIRLHGINEKSRRNAALWNKCLARDRDDSFLLREIYGKYGFMELPSQFHDIGQFIHWYKNCDDDSSLYKSVSRTLDSYFDEYAYIGVSVTLKQQHGWNSAWVESYYNEDYGMGRHRYDHTILTENFAFENDEDLAQKLSTRIPRALYTIGILNKEIVPFDDFVA